MFTAWKRLPSDRRFAYSMVAAALTTGTILKVFYFRFSRGIMVDDAERKHREGLEILKEAHEFSEWSRRDREARLPKLTTEQEAQMNEYLRIVENHGLSKAFAAMDSGEDCYNCPIMKVANRTKQFVTGKPTE